MAILVKTLRSESWPSELVGLWEALRSYFTMTGGVPTKQDFKSLVDRAGWEEARRQRMFHSFVVCWKAGVNQRDHEWQYATEAMLEDRASFLLIEALTETMKVVTEGTHDDKGVRHHGYDAARNVLGDKIARIESIRYDNAAAPEGDVRAETDAVWQEYEDARDSDQHWGVMTGFSELDSFTNGVQPGEFWLVAAYAGHGKTQTLINMAHRAVLDGRCVAFFTLETLREQVRRRILVRHANQPDFAPGVLYESVRGGRMSEEEEKVFQAALEDWKENPSYGRCEIFWAARGSTTEDLRMRTEALDRVREVDLVIVDYVALMGIGRSGDWRRRQEGLVQIIQELKGFATGHRRGGGVPVVSAYQTARAKVERAREVGYYTLDCLAETAEAERSADLVMSILRLQDDDRDLHAQVLKYRDGRTGDFILEADFARSLVGDRIVSQRSGGLLG